MRCGFVDKRKEAAPTRQFLGSKRGRGSERTRSYLPRINIKSQKIVSPKAGWQEGEEGKEASSPEGSNKNTQQEEETDTRGRQNTALH